MELGFEEDLGFEKFFGIELIETQVNNPHNKIYTADSRFS